MTDLHRWTALRLARALATRELTASALAESLIERTQAVDPALKAWAWFDAEHIRRSAKALDRGPVHGVLHGLPIGVKDIIDTAGIPTAYGSPIYAGHVPDVDAACVALARAAGAWVAGKTMSTELANMSPAPTRHPTHPGHTPGGSSSGSAAAVAAGLVPLALGTQTAGSVIRPAAYCGVVGFKPTARRIPRAGVKPNSDTLDDVGVLARTVGDAALLAGVLAGLSSGAALVPRLAWTATSRANDASPDSLDLIDAVMRRFAAAGAPVAQLAWPAIFDDLFEAQFVVQWFETARALEPEWLYRRGQLSDSLAQMLAQGRALSGEAYAAALATAGGARSALDAVFGDADAIVAPAATGAAPNGLASTGDPLFSRPWQLLGCPCIALPAGKNAQGLPLAVQLVGRPGDDDRLLAAAHWAESTLRS